MSTHLAVFQLELHLVVVSDVSVGGVVENRHIHLNVFRAAAPSNSSAPTRQLELKCARLRSCNTKKCASLRDVSSEH